MGFYNALCVIFYYSNNKALSKVLQELRSQLDSNETMFINVQRGAIWPDACRQITRKRFSPGSTISVKFANSEGTSKGAVDISGPGREFFRMAVKAANLDSSIFVGPETRRSLFRNSVCMY